MSFDNLVEDMDAEILEAMGDVAIYDGGTFCRVIIDKNVDKNIDSFENFNGLSENKTEITAETRHIPSVEIGKIFDVSGKFYTVKEILFQDHSIIKVAVV